jgi:hypothetical protein
MKRFCCRRLNQEPNAFQRRKEQCVIIHWLEFQADWQLRVSNETLKERGPAGEIFHLGQGGCYFWRDEPRKSIT